MTDDRTLQWLRNRIEIQEAALRFGRAVYSRDDGRSAGHEALRSGVIEIPATSTVIDPDEIADRGWKITRDRSEVEPRLREPRTELRWAAPAAIVSAIGLLRQRRLSGGYPALKTTGIVAGERTLIRVACLPS